MRDIPAFSHALLYGPRVPTHIRRRLDHAIVQTSGIGRVILRRYWSLFDHALCLPLKHTGYMSRLSTCGHGDPTKNTRGASVDYDMTQPKGPVGGGEVYVQKLKVFQSTLSIHFFVSMFILLVAGYTSGAIVYCGEYWSAHREKAKKGTKRTRSPVSSTIQSRGECQCTKSRRSARGLAA